MSQFGTCQYCGAEKVQNPKTGKVFCSAKCWLKNGQNAQNVQNSTNTQYQPQNAPTGQIEHKNGRSEDIRANVALKMVSELIVADKIAIEQWMVWANNFYNYIPNTEVVDVNQPTQQEEPPMPNYF